MQDVEVAAELWYEVLVQVVVLVDVDSVESVGAQTNHNALCGEARCFVSRAGVSDHDDPIRPYHTSVVDAKSVAFSPEAFNDRVDHDEVFDLWSCQLGL